MAAAGDLDGSQSIMMSRMGWDGQPPCGRGPCWRGSLLHAEGTTERERACGTRRAMNLGTNQTSKHTPCT